jgi:transmembrane sensor
MNDRPTEISDPIADAACVWLSRRDRGLTAAEQDAYIEWLYADPAHGRAIVQLERVWTTLNKLEQWRPAHSAIPNPDLLLPRRSPWAKAGVAASLLAAAAAVVLAVYAWRPASPDTVPRREAIVHPGAEKMTLADGSVVELNQGAKIDVRFSPGERHVRLLAGEAHFSVAKNSARPFFVDTGRVSVRAVGTAFSVALATDEVAVLVTEGEVKVLTGDNSPATANSGQGTGDSRQVGGGAGLSPVTSPLSPEISLRAGERTVVRLAPAAPAAPAVQNVTPAEIERALSWQALRLEFVDMPLGDVVTAFNRYNRSRLVVADAETAAIVVGGNFRADNIDAFVRLLDASFGVSATRNGNEITLRKAR